MREFMVRFILGVGGANQEYILKDIAKRTTELINQVLSFPVIGGTDDNTME